MIYFIPSIETMEVPLMFTPVVETAKTKGRNQTKDEFCT